MKALLLHCNYYATKITGLATRPAGIQPSEIKEPEQEKQNCILAFVTIEVGDATTKVSRLAAEIEKFCEETGRKTVVAAPFAHLSNQLATSAVAMPIFQALFAELRERDLEVIEGHFGSDKTLQLDVPGHPGNVRFREF